MATSPLQRRLRSLWKGLCCGLGSGLLLWQGVAQADSVEFNVSTLLAGRADPRDGEVHTVVPVYQSLGAQATILRPYFDSIHIVMSGWGSVQLDIGRSEYWSGDIDLGYIDGSFAKRRLQVRVGRQFVMGGAARSAQLDGAVTTLQLYKGLGITAYGGIPVTPRFSASRGDAMFGGRMFYRHSFDTEVGLSFNQVMGEGRAARQDLAVDARYVPHPQIALTGYTLYAIPEARLAEADFSVTWLPNLKLQFGADYRRTAPDLFLPLNSIFSVFSQETRDEVGGTVYLRPISRLRIYGDLRAVVNMEGAGARGGVKATVALGPRDHTTLSAELRLLKLPNNGYVQARLYSTHRLHPAWFVTLGANSYFLDQPINGQGYSFTGTGTVAAELGRGFRLVATGFADVTPFVERRVEFVVKLAYHATQTFREVSK
jgi:hypothetical protein